MKIRTDFVTNSSSSSFIVSLRAELSDGVVLKFESSEFDGDYTSTQVSFAATDKEGKSIYENWVSPERYVSFTEELPYEVTESVNLGPGKVDMLSITEAKNVGDLITAIKWPCIGVTYDLLHGDEEAHEDEEEYFSNESSREIIENTLADFNQMADDCDEIMGDHIKSVTDVKKVTVTYEFGGGGEFLAGLDEILSNIFGYDGQQIYHTIEQNDARNATEILKKMDCLKNVDDESVDAFISFVNESGYCPEECIIKLSINQEGKLHYSINYR